MLRESRRTIQTASHGELIISCLGKDNPLPLQGQSNMNPEQRENIDNCITEWLESRGSDNTRRSYKYALNEFLEIFWKRPEAMTREDVRKYAQVLKNRGLKASTINARLGAISSFYSFVVDEYHLMDHNPAEMRSLRVKVKQYAKSRALTTGEVKRLLGSMDLETTNGLRDYALLLGYLNLGRRNSEWRLARICDFEMAGNEMFYRWSGKGQVDNIDNVPKKLWQVINRYVAASGGRGIYDYIFLNRFGQPISARGVGRTLEKYVKLARITGKVRVHDLRHTAAMLRRQSGADVEEIREFLRHSSLVTTQIYLHRLERVVDRRAKSVFEMIAG
jgi:site-specific recombinase XerD